MYHEKQHLQQCLKHALNNLLQHEAFTSQLLNQISDNIGARRTWILGNYDANALSAALALHNMEVKWLDPRHTDLSSLDSQHVHQQQHCSSSNTGTSGPGSPADAPTQQETAAATQQQTQQQKGQCQHTTHNPQHVSCLVSLPGRPDVQQQTLEQQQISGIPPADALQQVLGSPPQQEQQQQDHSACEPQPELVGLVLNVSAHGWWSAVFGGRRWLTVQYLEGQWWNLDSRLPAPRSFVSSAEDESDGGTHRLKQYLQQQLVEGAHVMTVYRIKKEQQQQAEEQPQ